MTKFLSHKFGANIPSNLSTEKTKYNNKKEKNNKNLHMTT